MRIWRSTSSWQISVLPQGDQLESKCPRRSVPIAGVIHNRKTVREPAVVEVDYKSDPVSSVAVVSQHSSIELRRF